MTCPELAADLVARALRGAAQPGVDASKADATLADAHRSEHGHAQLDAHLAACAACRTELERLRRVTGAAAEAEALRASAVPPPAVLGRLLATVREDARERRSDAALETRAADLAAAVATTTSHCAGLREEIPALVLGHLDAAESARVAEHLALCPPCEAERVLFGRLLAAQRAVPKTGAPAGGAERLLAALRTDRAAAPAASADDADGGTRRLRTIPGRRRPRWFRIAFTAVAAASVVVAILVAPSAGGGARVCCDAGLTLRPRSTDGAAAVSRHVGRDAGAFPFAIGDELEATSEPAIVKLATSAAPGDGESAGDGELVLTLAPGTRVSRRGQDAVELRAGSVRVRAGRLAAPFRISHGELHASIVGTDLDVELVPDGAEPRLLVLVRAGAVDVGRGAAPPLRVGAGRAAITSAGLVRDVPAEGASARDALLAPLLSLTPRPAGAGAPGPLEFDAAFSTRLPTAVTIPGIDGNEPRLLLRLRGPDGREREVKIQRSMIVEGAADRPSVRIAPERPTIMHLRLDGLSLPEGRWEARLRYHAMSSPGAGTSPLPTGSADSGRPREPAGIAGVEWAGAVESPPVTIEIPSQDRTR